MPGVCVQDAVIKNGSSQLALLLLLRPHFMLLLFPSLLHIFPVQVGDRATCLIFAASYGYPGMVRALLRRGVQVNPQTAKVNIVCAQSRVFVVLMFVVCALQGRTALHWAASNRKEECVIILLDAGADKSIPDTVIE